MNLVTRSDYSYPSNDGKLVFLAVVVLYGQISNLFAQSLIPPSTPLSVLGVTGQFAQKNEKIKLKKPNLLS